MRFKENVALIVGGASGMGKATALQMAKEGASVDAFDWQKDKLEALKAEAAGLSGTLEIYAGNVNDEGARKGAVSYMKEKYGKMDPEGIGMRLNVDMHRILPMRSASFCRRRPLSAAERN